MSDAAAGADVPIGLDPTFSEVNDMDDAELMALEDGLRAEEELGGFEMCESGDTDWYMQARGDMAAYFERTEAGDASDNDGAAMGAAMPTTPEDVDVDAVDARDDEDVGGDFGMGDRSASYGGSWEDDPLDAWQPEAILKKSSQNKEVRYLVKWRGYAEPTWELYDDLEEEGHGPMIEAFHARKRLAGETKMQAHNSARPSHVPKVKSARSKKNRAPGVKPYSAPPLFDPARYWPDFLERIVDGFSKGGFQVTKVFNCCSNQGGARFYETWRKATTPTVPVMLFHGTRLAAIPSIVNSGLRVPGRGVNPVSVVNGSAYGVGIYTSTNTSLSHSYARDGYMFVCCGLVGDAYRGAVRQAHSSIVVFFESEYVVPCFLVKYRHIDGAPGPLGSPEYSDQRRDLSDELVSMTTAITAEASDIDATRAGLIGQLRQRYHRGCAIAGSNLAQPRTDIRGGGTDVGMPYDREKRSLTKKQLRAAPRAAKEAYKAGLLIQRQSKK